MGIGGRYSPDPDPKTIIDWTAATAALHTTNSGRFADVIVGGGTGERIEGETFLTLKPSRSSSTYIDITLEEDNFLELGVGGTGKKLRLTAAGGIIDFDDENLTGGTYNAIALSTSASGLILDDVTNSHSITAYSDFYLDGDAADGFLIHGGGTIERTITVTGADITLDAATQTGWGTSLTHAGDNTQAHSDYLLNSGNDETSGTLTAAGFITAGTLAAGKTTLTPGAGSPNTLDFAGDATTGIHYYGSYDFAFKAGGYVVLRCKSSVVECQVPFNLYDKTVSASPAEFVGSKYRGAALLDDDGITSLQAKGWDGSGYRLASSIDILADGNFSATSWPTRIEFLTTAVDSTTPTLRMTIDNAGNVDATGTIRTAADQDWDLGAASAQADFAGDTKIRVTIGGTDYDIVALAV